MIKILQPICQVNFFTDAPAKQSREGCGKMGSHKRRRLSKNLMTTSTEEEETNYSSDEEGEID